MTPLLWIIILLWLAMGFVGRCMAKYSITTFGGGFNGDKWGLKDELMGMFFVAIGLVGLLSVLSAIRSHPLYSEKFGLKI